MTLGQSDRSEGSFKDRLAEADKTKCPVSAVERHDWMMDRAGQVYCIHCGRLIP
jgi:hypothetical protein